MTTPQHAPSEKVACDLGLGDRSRVDGCPGALSFHHAEDGAIGRVRFPGGLLSPEQYSQFVAMSVEYGDGDIHLTTRGNVQVRGISDTEGFSRAALDAGFVPSVPHDKIRNIIASPLADLESYVRGLDGALLSVDKLSGLSGRTLFGLDKGDGAVLAQQPDFGALFGQHEENAQLILGGRLTDLTCAVDAVADSLVAMATAWQEDREEAWRVAEKPQLHAQIIESALALDGVAELAAPDVAVQDPQHIGWFDREDGTVSLGAGLPFGMIPRQVSELLTVVAKPVQVTPWHSVIVHNLDEGEAEAVAKVLAPMGLIFDAQSPRLLVTACTGLPGCSKSRSDVRADARQLMAAGPVDGRVHFSGCERRCGHPRVEYTDYLALGDGEYDVTTR